MADVDEEDILLLLLLRRRRRRWNASFRKNWTRKWIQRRHLQGAYSNLIRELNEESPDMFKQYHRLEHVLSMVGPSIRKQDTNMRSSIGPGERLAATLRFLATGETFRSLSFQFRIGERTMSLIVDESCRVLFDVMKTQYLKVPNSTEEWENISREFHQKWNYPFCVGALDGKHIAILPPADSGSQYFNYKHFFSVLLLALVDANYKFIYVDVGASGRAGDAGVFSDSSLKKALDDNTFSLPPPGNLECLPSEIDYHIIGDDAFPLSKRIMKPYPHRNLDRSMRIFNYRLSRARRVVENAFGILANRFRVFLTTINLSPEKVQNVILATCCLHNYMIDKNKHAYTCVQDIEDTQQLSFTAEAWRNDQGLTDLSPTTDRNLTKTAKEQRTNLTDYFLSDTGSVPWQGYMITVSRETK